MIIPITPELDRYMLDVAAICGYEFGVGIVKLLAERHRPESARAKCLWVYVLHQTLGYSIKTVAHTISHNHSNFSKTRKLLPDSLIKETAAKCPPAPKALPAPVPYPDPPHSIRLAAVVAQKPVAAQPVARSYPRPPSPDPSPETVEAMKARIRRDNYAKLGVEVQA